MPAGPRDDRGGGAEEFARSRQYDYRANSTLVLTAENRSRDPREPTGEPETLAGKKMFKFGDKVQREAIPMDKKGKGKSKKEKAAAASDADELTFQASGKRGRGQGMSVMDVETAGFYQPKTRDTRQAYDLLLSVITSQFGDQPQDVLRGAADEVLAVLKNDKLKDPEKEKEVNELLGSSSSEQFATLVQIGKRITDYMPEGLREEEEAAAAAGLDKDLGVAVEFEDEEEEEEGGEHVMEEVESDPDSEDGGGDGTEGGRALQANMDVDEGEEREGEELKVQEIDAYWLQRKLAEAMPELQSDEIASQRLADEVFQALQKEEGETFVETHLVELLGFQQFSLIKSLTGNRLRIVWCTRLARTQSDEERASVEKEMEGSPETLAILEALRATRTSLKERQKAREDKIRDEGRRLQEGEAPAGPRIDAQAAVVKERHRLDLDMLAFNSASSGGHFMPQGLKIRLPQGSFRKVQKGYEEVHVSAPKPPAALEGEALKSVSDIPDWAQPAFSGMKQLNRVQSKVYDTALFSSDNILLCAPTGAGKTNVAMLCILHQIGLHRKSDGSIDTSAFKIVYVAPMKALVAEMVGNFGKRLEPFGIQVRELTGDMNLSKSQIDETQVIVTTPEKWDIITRKSGDRTYTNLVKLLIIDEVHLLHDDRGPVLESIVARTLRHIEATQEMIRLVGLSATLPNYEDVAAFLRVKPDKGLFHFGNHYRPCPLQQQYIGVTVKKPLQRFQLMNEICYEKVLEGAGKHQMLIFVHSRKETAKTAKFLKESALKEDHLMKFVRDDAVTREVLQSESEHCKSNELRDILPYGFAIHHAGMTRADRQLVEDLFADGHVQVLVSTATLAWGVNLPAHTVIIKGTQVYNPVQSRWDELSPLDVMQMLGRAGRPQYDSYGEGIIITSHAELQYYLSLFNEQLPIESQYVATIPDNLNAEIVLGTVQNLREAAHWLGYTYMYVRMMRNPTLYGVPAGEVDVDRKLMNRRLDLIHSAAIALDQHKLIKYDRRTGNFQVTDLGRIASKFYVTHTTISVFNQHLKPTMGEIELLRLFSMADEFKYLIIREEEKLELAKLVDKVPVPVKEAVDEPTAKINVLLQAYVSNLKLEGLALVSDMVYVTQSAGRLMRCLFEVCLRRGWAVLAEKALALSKQVSKRMWSSATPLRQFGSRLSKDVLAKLEKKELAWDRFYDLSAQELGELIRMPKVGKSLHKHVHMFPRLELAAHVQPVTRSIIKIDLTLTPDFKWDPEVHGMVEPFWVICEDQDSEFILHSELFLLKSLFAEEEHAVAFTVPVQEPLPPQYYVKVVSDRWLNCQNVLPVSFRNLLLPDKFPPPTDLLDLQPLPVSALRNPEFEALYPDITLYNPIQTQVFTALYNTDDNCLVCAPTGSGKLLVAEFAVLRMIARARAGKGECRAVCMVPFDALARERCADWRRRLGKPLGLSVELLTGEAQLDLKLLERGNLVVTTPENWDMLSRRWKQRAAVRKVALFICDEVHLLGGERGPAMEVTLARMRYISSEVKRQEPMRIIGLGASTANAKDLGDWLGASSNGLFNFPPSVRPVPLEIHIQAFDIVNFEARMQAMLRPTFTSVVTFTEDKKKPALVFSPTRKHARIAASELVLMAEAEKRNFLQCMPSDLETYLESVQDPRLRDCLQGGVGILHETQPEEEQQVVRLLFESGAIRVLVATAPMVWAMSLSAMLVVVMGTLYFDGSGVGHSNYPVTDLLQMMGAASRPGKDDQGVCVLMCHTARKEYYKKFLFEALPVESQLDKCLHDHFNAEIVTGVIANKQDAVDYLTWTFFYRRLPANPNFYNMTNRSHRHVSDHLSDLVENTLADLEQSKAIAIEDDMDVEALNLGMIAAYYYISYTTIERFAASLKPRTKLKGLLAILSAASEYETLLIRPGEDAAIAKILKHAPYAIENPRLTDPNCKANALLQAHFGRLKVAGDLAADQREVLLSASRLLQALVDVIASNGWLHPALAAMELSQMVTQGLSDRDSPLMQLPHFTRDLAARCQRAGIESIIELLEMQDDARSQLLALTDRQLHDVASFCNRYPEIDLTLGIEEGSALEATAGENTQLVVLLERQLEEDLRPVDAPRFPKTRDETWWLVIGDPEANTLLAIKKVSLQKKQKVKVAFQAPTVVGKRKLMLYFMCDAYMGCDQEYDFMIDITADADADDNPDDNTMDQD